MHLGRWEIDDDLVFPVNTHSASTGAATDADSVPTYRVYEMETGTAILTGSTAKLDDTNTTGFYSEQITLSAANGFEVGKAYTIYVSATVGGVVGTTAHTFQVENTIPTAAVIADAVWDEVVTGHVTANTFGQSNFTVLQATAQAGTASTITLNSGAVNVDDYYNGTFIFITSGTGPGQVRRIIDYVGSTRVATISPNWHINPTSSSVFSINQNAPVEVEANALIAIAAAIWDRLTSALTTASSIGKLLVDNINATISSRASQTSVDTVDDFIDTEITDIRNRLPAALVSGRMDASVGAMAANVLTDTAINADAITAAKLAADVTTELQSGLATAASISTLQTSVDDLPTNAELATSQAAADDVTLAAIAALNNLSAAQVNVEVDTALADVGLTTTITGRIDAAITTRASQVSVDDIPTNAELAASQAAADDATLAAIAALTFPDANDVADAVLSRGVSNVQDTADVTSLAGLILAAFESSVVGTTWTIRKTGGTTFTTKTVTLDPDADPVTGVT